MVQELAEDMKWEEDIVVLMVNMEEVIRKDKIKCKIIMANIFNMQQSLSKKYLKDIII